MPERYTIKIIEDTPKTKVVHFEKDGVVFLKAIQDKETAVVNFHGDETINMSLEELEQFPKDMKKLFAEELEESKK